LIFNGAPLFDAIRAVVLLVLVSLLAIAFLRPASRAGRPSFGTA
jgi:hypothetical protein